VDDILAAIKQRSRKWEAKGEEKEKMIIATAHPAALLILHLYFKKF